jgi:hypothetical protein
VLVINKGINISDTSNMMALYECRRDSPEEVGVRLAPAG